MKQTIAKILLLILSPVLFFGITEISFRQFGGDRVKNYYDQQTAIVLGKPVPKKKPGEYRAFLYGGSSAYGFPVTDRSSVSAWLRRSFEKLLPDVEVNVMNCAWPGKASHHDLQGVYNALRYQPDLFVVYTGHNEANITNRIFSDSGLARLHLSLSFRSSFYIWFMSRMDRLRKFLKKTRGNVQPREEIIAQNLYSRADVTDAEYKNITAHFKKNIETIISLAKARKIPVVLVTPSSNVREIGPRKSMHSENVNAEDLKKWEGLFEKGKEAMASKQYAEAADLFRQAALIDNAYSELHYLLGQSLEQAGNLKDARQEFLAARDFDAIPNRAKTELIEILKTMENPPQVMLVDMDKVFEGMSPNGIVGFEYIYDDVHPTVKGQQIIAEEILKALSQNHWIKPAAEWRWDEFEKLRDSDLWKVDSSQEAYHDILTALILWQQKDYKGAAVSFEKGLVSMPGFIESYAFLGDSYYRTGDLEKAAAAFKSLQLKDPELDKALRAKYPDLQDSYSHLPNPLPAAA